MNIKEMSATMADMQKEMMKLGLVSEMMEDAMDSVNDDTNLDNEEELDKVINEME